MRFSHAAKTVLALALGGATSFAQEAQAPFPVTSVVDAPSIAGRPVVLDAQGKLLPWPMPDNTGYSYSGYFLSQWTILWDQYNRQRLPYFYCCFDFDRTAFELFPGEKWVNSTGYLRAMMQGFIERLYPYTGDPRTLEFLQSLVDYELENGRTPEGYAWARVPYPSANPGARRYTGWSHHGEDFIEPHVVGEDGYAYLRLYEMTGNTRYLQAAIRCAEALVKNFKAGDEKNSPWPNRCFARDGSLGNNQAMFPYSANVIEPIMLFDELIRIGQGDVASYKKVREGAWQWFVKYPLQNNVWVGYFQGLPGAAHAPYTGQSLPLYVTFDDPHLAAGTVLNGQYPSGAIDWPDGEWQIGVPGGKFGTFNLVLRNPEAQSAEFRFAAPRILVGFDVCNDRAVEATLTVRADGIRETSYKIKPGELLRIRTGWRDAVSRVAFTFQNAPGLRFDNLAYAQPQ